jgi:hypothetical protein
MILLSGFAFYSLILNNIDSYNKSASEVNASEWNRNREQLAISSIQITSENKLSLTVKNTGSVSSKLIWLGLFNQTATPEWQRFANLSKQIEPAENTIILPADLPADFIITQGRKYVIQLVTEAGNVFDSKFYPASEVNCALSLTVGSPTTYAGNNVTVMLTVTLNDTEVDIVQNITASISAAPTGIVDEDPVGNSPLTVTGLARGESAFFWWVYKTINTGTVTFTTTYSSAPVGSDASANVTVLATPGQGGGSSGNVVVSGINGTAEYNPSQWKLLGGTLNVSGTVADLATNNSIYAVFNGSYTGSTNNHFVDNSSSNVDGSPNLGTHSNFTAQQYGPDSINDTLTEADTKGYTLNDWVDSNTSNVDGHTGHGTSSNFTAQQYTDTINDTLTEAATSGGSEAWVSPTNFQDPASVWSTETNAYDESISTNASCSVAANSWSGYLVLNLTASTTGSKLEYYVGRSGNQINNMTIDVANATGSWANIYAGAPSVGAWTNVTGFTHTITAIRFNFYNSHSSQARTAYVYEADYLNNGALFNYELDYEFQWTSANYTSDNEQLCIRTGPLNSETIGVDVWNGASWINIRASLTANLWNNISIATYLTNGTITFRYLGGTESGDTVQSTWQIESALLHTWNNSNYRLDIEVQFQNVDNTTVYSNKELWIFAGTWSTSETIKVDVWNTTSSSWVNVIASLTANAWNNVSLANLLTATVTIRFTDGTPSSDTVQDSWSIDATLLHAWSNVYTSEVEFTGSSNLQNWTCVLWQIQSCWDIDNVSVSIQLYNFTLGNYASSGSGYLSYVSSATPNFNQLQFKSETLSANDFKNATTGYWKIKVTGVKSTGVQFLMKIDWIDIQTAYSTNGSTIPYNTWQYYSIIATTTNGNPIPYAYVAIYSNGNNTTFQNAIDGTNMTNPVWVYLDVSGTYLLKVNSASATSETFVIYAVVGSVVGQKTVTQEP